MEEGEHEDERMIDTVTRRRYSNDFIHLPCVFPCTCMLYMYVNMYKCKYFARFLYKRLMLSKFSKCNCVVDLIRCIVNSIL